MLSSISLNACHWNFFIAHREPSCGIFSWLCSKTDEIVVVKHENDSACRWFHHCLVHEICNIFVPGVIWSKLSTPTDSCSLSEREKQKKKNDTITRLLLYLPTFLVTTTTPINRRHAIYLVLLRRWSQPRFSFSGELFLVKSTASWSSVREMPLLAADRVRRCQITHAQKPYY